MEEMIRRDQSADKVSGACVSALSDRFVSRGLVKSALNSAKEQIAAEEKTRELAPCAYRLSLLSEAAVTGIYKRGKEYMTAEDLIRYAEETRRMRPVEETPEEACDLPVASETESSPAAMEVAPNSLKERSAELVQRGIELGKTWFDVTPNTVKSGKRFPLSAFAAVAAIAVSLMLIVAGALMVTSAETKISTLNSEIATLSAEVDDLESKLETQHDLMEIRRIAVEEYGMVEETYLKMDYVTLDSEEEIQVYNGEKDRKVGLAAILSAIGWK